MILACDTEDCSTANDSEAPEDDESGSAISNEPPRKKKCEQNKFLDTHQK